MDEMLRKIDQIRERVGVSYTEAKDALEKNGGNVVDAIIFLERQTNSRTAQTIEQGKNAWQEVKGAVEKSRGTKIRVVKEGKPVAEIPAAAGVLGLVGAMAIPGGAVVGALGSVAAMLNKYSLEISREDREDETEEPQKNIDKKM